MIEISAIGIWPIAIFRHSWNTVIAALFTFTIHLCCEGREQMPLVHASCHTWTASALCLLCPHPDPWILIGALDLGERESKIAYWWNSSCSVFTFMCLKLVYSFTFFYYISFSFKLWEYSVHTNYISCKHPDTKISIIRGHEHQLDLLPDTVIENGWIEKHF